MERWIKINDYPDYEVSNTGNIRSTDRISTLKSGVSRKLSGRIMSKRLDSLSRYLLVDLTNEYGRKTFLVHRLVASAFIGDITENKQVNHINGVTTDNTILNLEIVTAKENEFHKRNVLLKKADGFSGKFGSKHPRSKAVFQSLNGITLKKWESINQVTRELNYDASSIVKCCKGKINTYKGFVWRYAF